MQQLGFFQHTIRAASPSFQYSPKWQAKMQRGVNLYNEVLTYIIMYMTLVLFVPASGTHHTSGRYGAFIAAIQREKNLKKWRRQWKIDLIEKVNPHWHRLCPETGSFIVE